ncbi:hypothetical protein F4801DRAFT_89261 [Xylaria longipes]|nr:hypothetical protein F4801DRAFT_89261 [Xylaria longipes]
MMTTFPLPLLFFYSSICANLATSRYCGISHHCRLWIINFTTITRPLTRFNFLDNFQPRPNVAHPSQSHSMNPVVLQHTLHK